MGLWPPEQVAGVAEELGAPCLHCEDAAIDVLNRCDDWLVACDHLNFVSQQMRIVSMPARTLTAARDAESDATAGKCQQTEFHMCTQGPLRVSCQYKHLADMRAFLLLLLHVPQAASARLNQHVTSAALVLRWHEKCKGAMQCVALRAQHFGTMPFACHLRQR